MQLPLQNQQPEAAVWPGISFGPYAQAVEFQVLALGEGSERGAIHETFGRCRLAAKHTPHVRQETFDLVASVSLLHECFVFGQFMQAENTPLSLQILRQRQADAWKMTFIASKSFHVQLRPPGLRSMMKRPTSCGSDSLGGCALIEA